MGSQGLTVARVGFGCTGLSRPFGEGDDDRSVATLHRAIDLGVTLIDTADAYGRGHNEELVGRALRGRRDQVRLATKFGYVFDENGTRGVDGSPEHVRRACDASLRRLDTDYIDLYYQHRVDGDVPVEETAGAMAELVEAGKVRYLGLSEAAAATVRRAHEVHPISALQSEYSLWSRDVEPEILGTCRALGIGFVAYSPLGRGFLTGSITSVDSLLEDDFRRLLPRFDPANLEHNLELVHGLERMASAKGAAPAQLALAWVLARGDDVVPIPGTRRIAHLESNLAALDIELTPEDLAALDEIAPPGGVAGDRYPDMSWVNR